MIWNVKRACNIRRQDSKVYTEAVITPSLPHPLTPSPPHSLTPSPPHSLTPSPLTPSPLTPSPPHSLTPSLPHSLTVQPSGGGCSGHIRCSQGPLLLGEPPWHEPTNHTSPWRQALTAGVPGAILLPDSTGLSRCLTSLRLPAVN